MHELSLMEGIVETVENSARQQNFTQVRTLWLEIGQLASVEIESLRFAFSVVSQGGILAGANMEIVHKPGTAWCMKCLQSVVHESLLAPCSLCGSYQMQVTSGDKMRVLELEVI